ncbi:hypothetical protein [Streptosporangium sp. NPDC051022]|uniref:hypothetical protein n=1 Tax=Streptosporangium sp. NPDC051022 TaxID=3155752 RepID=UPI00343C9979
MPGLSPGSVMHLIKYSDGNCSYAQPKDLDSWRTDLTAEGWTVVDAPGSAE